MKLSEYPLLATPSSGAVVPVIDGGANYTYPLNNLGGESGYSVTLASNAASVPLPLLDKGKIYDLAFHSNTTTTANLLLSIRGIDSSSLYSTRYIYGYEGGLISALDGPIGGLAVGYNPNTTVQTMLRMTIGLIDILRVNCLENRAESSNDGFPTATTRMGRCSQLLSELSGSQVQLDIKPSTGLFKAGTYLKISEI